MQIRNKVIVNLHLEDGCKQEDDEVTISWTPINFSIYSDLFPEIIKSSIYDWLADNEIGERYYHEVIFAHCMEYDGAGAVTSEYFEPVFHERQIL